MTFHPKSLRVLLVILKVTCVGVIWIRLASLDARYWRFRVSIQPVLDPVIVWLDLSITSVIVDVTASHIFHKIFLKCRRPNVIFIGSYSSNRSNGFHWTHFDFSAFFLLPAIEQFVRNVTLVRGICRGKIIFFAVTSMRRSWKSACICSNCRIWTVRSFSDSRQFWRTCTRYSGPL